MYTISSIYVPRAVSTQCIQSQVYMFHGQYQLNVYNLKYIGSTGSINSMYTISSIYVPRAVSTQCIQSQVYRFHGQYQLNVYKLKYICSTGSINSMYTISSRQQSNVYALQQMTIIQFNKVTHNISVGSYHQRSISEGNH